MSFNALGGSRIYFNSDNLHITMKEDETSRKYSLKMTWGPKDEFKDIFELKSFSADKKKTLDVMRKDLNRAFGVTQDKLRDPDSLISRYWEKKRAGKTPLTKKIINRIMRELKNTGESKTYEWA